jgi:hypothetical protein
MVEERNWRRFIIRRSYHTHRPPPSRKAEKPKSQTTEHPENGQPMNQLANSDEKV